MSAQKGPITTHILDTSVGKPAAGVTVVLSAIEAGVAKEIGRGTTDADGRVFTLLAPGTELRAGVYRIAFSTREYFARTGQKSFYPRVEIEFSVDAPSEHYHVPLLLNPFGYSTYRGS
jgi:5-hydroxyisourate hydrolase